MESVLRQTISCTSNGFEYVQSRRLISTLERSGQESDSRIIVLPKSAPSRCKSYYHFFVHSSRIDQRRRIFHITRDHGARLNDLVKRAFVFPRRDQNARIYAVQPFPPLSGSLERFAVVLRFRGEPHPGITPQGCINARWKYVFAVVPGV